MASAPRTAYAPLPPGGVAVATAVALGAAPCSGGRRLTAFITVWVSAWSGVHLNRVGTPARLHVRVRVPVDDRVAGEHADGPAQGQERAERHLRLAAGLDPEV